MEELLAAAQAAVQQAERALLEQCDPIQFTLYAIQQGRVPINSAVVFLPEWGTAQ